MFSVFCNLINFRELVKEWTGINVKRSEVIDFVKLTTLKIYEDKSSGFWEKTVTSDL